MDRLESVTYLGNVAPQDTFRDPGKRLAGTGTTCEVFLVQGFGFWVIVIGEYDGYAEVSDG